MGTERRPRSDHPSGPASETRLDRAERELAVRRLIDRYAHGCDTDDAGLVASLFREKGRVVVGGVGRTGEELRRFYAAGGLSTPSLHFTTGLTMSERSDGLIDATCGLLALETLEDRMTMLVGRYRDVVEVVDGQAWFVEREIIITAKYSLDSADR